MTPPTPDSHARREEDPRSPDTRLGDPYRADHVGSLLRPREVLGAVSAETIDHEIIDQAVLEVLSLQRQAGLPIFTDGEYHRTGFLGGFIAAVDGFDLARGVPIAWKGGDGSEPQAASNTRIVTRALTPMGRIAGREATFLREHAPGPFKITLPSSGSFALHGWRKELSHDAYATREALVEATGDILAAEARALAADGAAYLQFDAPGYTNWIDQSQIAEWRGRGVDLARLLTASIAGDNKISRAAKTAGVTTTGCHICRGNNMGRWMQEGGYDPVAEQLFTTLSVDRLLLEYDTDNAGGFEPLRFVPKGTVAVLGLISTKSGTLETRDEVLRRIEEATRHLPIAQLALSPQCGFASAAAGNPLTAEEQWRKLELVVSVADEVWG